MLYNHHPTNKQICRVIHTLSESMEYKVRVSKCHQLNKNFHSFSVQKPNSIFICINKAVDPNQAVLVTVITKLLMTWIPLLYYSKVRIEMHSFHIHRVRQWNEHFIEEGSPSVQFQSDWENNSTRLVIKGDTLSFHSITIIFADMGS